MTHTPRILVMVSTALCAVVLQSTTLPSEEATIQSRPHLDRIAVDPDGPRNPPHDTLPLESERSSAPDPVPPLEQIREAVVSGPAGEQARTMSLVVRDFDRDGIEDIAVTTDYSGDTYPWDEQGLTILLGDGFGGFEEHVRYTWRFFNPHTIFQTMVCGDFDEDDTEDLAILNAPFGPSDMPTIIFMLGQGDGTFEEETPHLELAAEVRMMPTPSKRLTLDDFNGDGHLDIGVASTVCGNDIVNLELLFGDGSCSFTSSLFPGENSVCTAIACGDFNEDGHPDVMSAGGSGNSAYSVYLNDSQGSGDFTPLHVTIEDFEITSMALGDLNGDGHIDAVFPGHGGEETACMIFGFGDGTFSSPVALGHHLFRYEGAKGMDVAVGDVNNDRRADLVFGCEGAATIEGVWAHGALFVLPGDGTGDFSGVGDGGLMIELPSVPEEDAAFTCYDVNLADLDDDGDLDIVGSTMFRSAVESFMNHLWKNTPEIWIEPHPTLEIYQPYGETAIWISDRQSWQNLDSASFTVIWDGMDISGPMASYTVWGGSAEGRTVRGALPGLLIPGGDHWMILEICDLDGNVGGSAYQFTD